MATNNQPPLQSTDAKFDQDGFEAIKTDLVNQSLQIEKDKIIHLTGANRVVAPRPGNARLYAVSDTATASSSSTANHVLTAMFSGQVSDISQDSQNNEIEAYKEYFMGERYVGKGSVLSLDVTVTGSPTPTLSNDNFTIRCELTEE